MNSKGILINACEAEIKEAYYCCHCFKQVKLISTDSRIYFRHHNEVDNEINERSIHKNGKELIATEIKKFKTNSVETEFFLPEINQRPDIFVNRRVAFEYQCAKINVKTLSERVDGYRSLKIKNIWIIGGDYLDTKVRKEHLKFIRYNNKWGFHLLMLDSEYQLFKIFHHISFVGPFNKIVSQQAVFRETEFSKIFKFKPQKNILNSIVMNDYGINKIRRKNDLESQKVKMNFYKEKDITVEEYLLGKTFPPRAPVYSRPAWQMICTGQFENMNQPFL